MSTYYNRPKDRAKTLERKLARRTKYAAAGRI